ncbi:hypothetical protein H4S07_000336 [Coemansia furcata]|uniref:Uncharacterized protein n=1 Tax=Coemansia furcata TaxID=417177 RepID=A0ACC1LR16_9FUNG|nr:hypothetical protein H4S07_000336 [Coemansia furcata]
MRSSDDDVNAIPVASASTSNCESPTTLADNVSECGSSTSAFAVPVVKSKPSSRRVVKAPAKPKSAPKTATSQSRAKHYVPLDDEEVEHDGLEVINENTPGDTDAETSDELPCRTLDNFVVFDEADGNVFSELEDIGMEYVDITISGNVEPIKATDLDSYFNYDQAEYDDDDDDESCAVLNVSGGSAAVSDSEGSGAGKQKAHARPARTTSEFTQRIKLSAILNYETHLTKSGETEIWVRTCFAWYKLLNPDPRYASIYSNMYKKVYIAHQALVRSKAGEKLTIAQFVKELQANPSDTISSLAPITEGDFRKYRQSIIEEIQICAESTEQEELLETPLIKAICGGKAQPAAPSAVGRTVRSGNKGIVADKTKNENPACITPLVASIAQGLYARHLLNVSHFGSKDTSTPSGDEGATDESAWRKRYTEGTKPKLKSKVVDKVKGRVAMVDLEAHVSLDKFRVSRVNMSDHARLPTADDDNIHYSEVSVVPTASADTTADITIKVGDIVLVRAPPPTGGVPLDSLWDNATSDPVEERVVRPTGGSNIHVYAVQVISISLAESASAPTFHGQLLLPGRDTLLQEVAAANEFFLVDNCQTYEFNSALCGKVDIPFIPSNTHVDTAKWTASGRLFCKFWYDLASGSCEDVNFHGQTTDGFLPMWCKTCERNAKDPGATLGRRIGGSDSGTEYVPTAIVDGVDYHQYDTVYLPSLHPDQPFEIGSIKKFYMGVPENKLKFSPARVVKADVLMLKRIRVLPVEIRPPGENVAYNDERHLYWTPVVREVEVSNFKGKCWIVHPDDIKGSLTAYKDTDFNAFYAKYKATKPWPSREEEWVALRPLSEEVSANDSSIDIDSDDKRASMPPCCEICKRERRQRNRLLEQFMKSPSINVNGTPASSDEKPASFARGQHPLRALDLFSGCGGLTQGMDQSGVVKTKWSVEFMPAAGYTFATNHPDAQVYNECSNLLLDSAIRAHRGETVKPLINKFDAKELPPMPQPGDVDFIYCGPPCQGFSRCNRFIKADDIKTSLVANALSYVDFYRPTYFLLENVRGLLSYKLGGVQVGPGKVSGGIEMGMLKFILRTLTTMGYQARFYLLQAGNYGLAQSRRRLFVWACKRGCRLPGVPRPITTFGKSNQTNINFPDGTIYAPHAHFNGNAPHHAISVDDAIGDLPKYEFVNPEDVYPDPEAAHRPSDWPQYIAVNKQRTTIPGDLDGSCTYVGQMKMAYTSPPKSEFQRLRRRKEQVCIPGLEQHSDELVDTLYNHVSRKFNSLNVERVCRVKLEPGMDHHSLPEKLQPWCLTAKESAASRHNGWKGLFGRLDPNGYFGTALTELQPMGKSGTVLLYDQRRVLSVRECARAQGFPDTFKFLSSRGHVSDMHLQVGNAVPPPLAYALSLELREALFQDYLAHASNSEPSPDAEDIEILDDFAGDVCVDIPRRIRTPPALDN